MERETGLALVFLQQLIVQIHVVPALEHLRLPLGQTGPHGKFSLGEIDGLVVVHISCSSILFIFKDHCFTSCAEISRIFHKISKAAPGRSRIEPHLVLRGAGESTNARAPIPDSRSSSAPSSLETVHFHIWGSSSKPLLSAKNKTPLSLKETKANKPLRVPLFLPEGHPIPATQMLPGNGRHPKGLLGFSPLLQGDLPRLLPSALHQTAALCASQRRVLVLFCAL